MSTHTPGRPLDTLLSIISDEPSNDEFMSRLIQDAAKEKAALTADNARLREALDAVMGWYNLTDVAALMSDKGEQAEYHRTIRNARAALAGKGGDNN